MKNEIKVIIKAMLEDTEVWAGGVFSKESYYMEKYNLTDEQMVALQKGVFFMLHIDDEEYRNRLLQM